MFRFGERKSILEEEDLCCRFCEYATVKDDAVFCKKKKAAVEAEGQCSSFAYDLLKRRPASFKMGMDLSDLEFPVI